MTSSNLFQTIICSVLALLVLPFGFYAIDFGQGGLRDALPEPHYLMSDNPTANLGIFIHMIAGALVTCLVPFQLIAPLRNRFPALHRWAGRIIGSAAIITAIGGLIYIPLRGTIGGWPMDAGFTLYGALTLITAFQTIRFARARQFARHRNWALRFFWLAIGSWLYRVHYGLWYLATDGLWSNPGFTGAFDLAQNVAFYLPHLIGVEVYLARKRYRVVVS
ncbi:DUF2306 domain-containing protein [Cognatiyoonia sp. IB215182]|uniref:DUF2306 domain-containing protein n=1 Tax=Cognatiyoonia sp. IB215182 TaxID=3097353 RepID=UPI002A0D7B57|nr:DUF2306 domain-containing protein [Cognatiyoonia sp. IB215182]MDX8351699.1 DUF2306 domain-containing protein [Cognatiyoonia sp. IB215182]